MSLGAHADRIAAGLHGLDPDDALILGVIPNGDAHGRAVALSYFARVATELRRRGWTIDTGVRHLGDGAEALYIADPIAPPTGEAAHARQHA